MTFRKVIHIDMDAFYASVEQRDFPKYRGKPLVVGGSAKRGVVSAASYEARKYGIHSAMPVFQAKKKCPQLIIVRGRGEIYKKVSEQLIQIFRRYTDLIEPLSLDEAFLDVSQNKINLASATLIAEKIRAEIKNETDLTASAGVSYNKFLAKIASDYKKPNGLFVIEPKDAQNFLDDLPVEKFFGIGKVTAQKMHEQSIFFGHDLRSRSRERLIKSFGKNGSRYYDLVRGKDNRPVNPNRIRKSVGAEKTFGENISERHLLEKQLIKIADKLDERVQKKARYGKTLTLKIKFSDFNQITRIRTFDFSLNNKKELVSRALDLLNSVDIQEKSVRLLGLSLSNFQKPTIKKAVQLKIDFKHR